LLHLKSDVDSVRDWSSVNFTKPNFSKIRFISFTIKINILNYKQTLGNFPLFRTGCSKDVRYIFNCEAYCHHVDFVFPRAWICRGVVRTIAFSSADSLLIRSKHGYASVAWHSVTVTVSNNVKRRAYKERLPSATNNNRFPRYIHYHYVILLGVLNLQTRNIRRRHPDDLSFISVCYGTKFWSFRSMKSALAILCILSSSSRYDAPAVGWVTAANAVHKLICIFFRKIGFNWHAFDWWLFSLFLYVCWFLNWPLKRWISQ
jgi:hypothetical protein